MLPGFREWRRAAWMVWGLAALALLPAARRLERVGVVTAPVGSPSADAAHLLATRFSGAAAPLVLVMRGLPAVTDTAGATHTAADDTARALIRRMLQPLAQSGLVRGLQSPATSLDTLYWSHDRRDALALVTTANDVRDALPSLRALTALMTDSARHGFFGPAAASLQLQWTGDAALLADLKSFAAAELRRTEWRALPLTLLIAWWAFGTVMEAAIALMVAALVVVTSLGVVGLATSVIPASPITASLVSLTGLALSVDYQLLVRRAARHGRSPAHARRTVWWAALLVSTAFALLALLPTGDLRSAAAAGVVTTMVAALAAIARATMLPPHAPLDASPVGAHATGLRAARWVTAHPVLVVLMSALCLLWLAWPLQHVRLASNAELLLPQAVESRRAVDDLAAFGRGSLPLALTVLVELPAGQTVFDPDGWAHLQRGISAVRAMPGVARVDGITTIGTGERIVAEHAFPGALRSAFVSTDAHWARILVVPASTRSAEAVQLADRVERVWRATSPRVVVSGLPVLVRDVGVSVRHALPWIVTATMLASLLLITWRFGSLVLALKAVIANALVAAAALGIVVRLFQTSPTGAAWMGPGVDGVFPTVPLLVFTAAFALSMDYELFLLTALVHRMHRDSANPDRGLSERVAESLVEAGPFIWRAAALATVVCGAFAASDFLPLAMTGAALASAVVLDATLVRLLFVPAWLVLAGRWNWWPRRMPRAWAVVVIRRDAEGCGEFLSTAVFAHSGQCERAAPLATRSGARDGSTD